METARSVLGTATRVAPATALGLVLLSCAVGIAQPAPRRAPFSPEFVEYQREVAAGRAVMRTAKDGNFGYAPCPVDTSHITPRHTGRFGPLQSLPAAFDLRNQGSTRLTPVRDQKHCGSCWAFAACASLESCLLPAESWNFSENNMKNTHGFDWSHSKGGNATIATAYLARWGGPVKESEDPYNPDSGQSPKGLRARKHVQEVLFLAKDPNEAKWAIVNHGALYCSYFHDDLYFNPTTNAYYYDGSAKSNHCVAIVGWNDNYPRSRFGTLPPGNGAWTVKNSYGTSWGDAGYHCISYHDASIGSFVLFRNAEPIANYDRVYQHDPLGWTSEAGYGAGAAMWIANVFTAAQRERLSAIAFYATDSVGSYEAAIYRGVANTPSDGTQATGFSGAFSHAGYLTVPLPAPVDLQAGEKFSVVLRLVTPNHAYPAAVERPIYGYSNGATASPGQSFYRQDGTSWKDLTSLKAAESYCIKALTISLPDHAVTGISPNAGANSGPVDVAISGTGFRAGATVSLSRSGGASIAGANVVVLSATKIACRFDLQGAATGLWDVEVINPGPVSARLPGGFTVGAAVTAPAPTVTGVSPGSGANDSAVDVTITGTGFRAGATARLVCSGQGDIDATGLVVVSGVQITCRFDLRSAAPDTWDVVVVSSDGQEGGLAGGFAIEGTVPGAIDEDFETGGLSTWPWVTVGSSNWHVTTARRYRGAYAAQAGAISHGQSTYLEVRLTCRAGNVSFHKRVSSEKGGDHLRFKVDGVELEAWSGNATWTSPPHTYLVSAGTHTFRWEYTKNGGVSEGQDTAWVDDITFPPMASAAPTVTGISPNSAANDGPVNATIDGTDFQAGATARLTKAGQPPIEGTNTVVTSSTQITCRFDVQGVAAGAWDVEVNHPGMAPECLVGGFTVTQPSGTVDEGFETGDFSKWPWDTGGDADWRVTNTDKFTGAYCAQAGAILTGSTYLQVKLACQAGHISFNKKIAFSWLGTSSLNFIVDGVQVQGWDGTTLEGAWQPTAHRYAVAAGTHTFRWEYRTHYYRTGESTAWVDDITFPPQTAGVLAVTGAVPASAANDAVVDVTILGTGFQAGATTRLSTAGAAPISGANVVVVSPTEIDCRFDLRDAPAGPRDVEVTNPGAVSARLTDGFTVTGPAVDPPPKITAISPSSGATGAAVDVTIVGTGFRAGATTRLSRAGAAPIAGTKVVVVSASEITCGFSLQDAATGPWNVEVAHAGGQVGALEGGFTVLAPPGVRHTFPSGLQMISVPVVPTDADPAQLRFDGSGWARWDPALKDYRVYPHTHTMLAPPAGVPGKGYWARFAAATEVAVPGLPPPGGAYTVQVPAGWAQIGNPRLADVPWRISGAGALRARRGGDEKTLAQAQAAGWCEDFVWGYEPQTGYELVYDPAVASVGRRQKLRPWQGYWFRAHKAVELIFPAAGTAPTAADRPPVQRDPSEWSLPLIAALEGGPAAQVVVGQAAMARQMELPPGFGGGVELGVVGGSRRLGVDLRERGKTSVWTLEASTGVADVKVLLRWPDLSEVPCEYRPVLVDTATGKRTYMRTSRGYAYHAGAAGTRRFEVHTAAGEAAFLAVTGVAAAMESGGNVELRLVLSATAAVDAEVLNSAGRQVGTICRSREMERGSAAVLWNATGDRGTRLPAGRYLIRVSARAEDGQHTSAIVPLRLGR